MRPTTVLGRLALVAAAMVLWLGAAPPALAGGTAATGPTAQVGSTTTMTIVPNVSYLPVDAAIAAIIDAGLYPQGNGPPFNAYVTWTNPEAGTVLPIGSTVTMFIVSGEIP